MSKSHYQPSARKKRGARDEISIHRIKCLGDLIIRELELRGNVARTTGNLDQLWQLTTALDSLVDLTANTYAFHKYRDVRKERGADNE